MGGNGGGTVRRRAVAVGDTRDRRGLAAKLSHGAVADGLAGALSSFLNPSSHSYCFTASQETPNRAI